MKKLVFATIVGSLPLLMMAQGATDVYQMSQNELRGTARFMSMAGAFGALGGDLSTLNQNPAGLGVYRSSEIGLTVDIDFQGSAFQPSKGIKTYTDQTKVALNNVAYIGTAQLYSDVMPTFSWGLSFSRQMSFDRIYNGQNIPMGTSLSNYIANMSQNYSPDELFGTTGYDPFNNSNVPWLSALAYNTYLINEVGGQYNGLYQQNSQGTANTIVREKGSADEYSIAFGGNISNKVYWGLSFGILDLSYNSYTYYTENIDNARIPNASASGVETGSAWYGLGNEENISGTGFNCKLGVIVKPINELRLGLAVHTPTYYSLQYGRNGWVDYDLRSSDYSASSGYAYTNNSNNLYDYTGYSNWDAKLHTPWKLIASAAGVIGGRGILSLDYEYNAYQHMSVGDYYGTFEDVSGDIRNYYRASNTVRIGAEYRLTPQWSVRAGYSYKSSPAQSSAYNNQQYIYTTGTNPAYTFDNSIQYITCGLGYRSGGFYADVAYVHKYRESHWSAFSYFGDGTPPTGTITDNNNHLVMSLGYKF